jgi:Fe-S-cluster containining protein
MSATAEGRTEFGFNRTACACANCAAFCRFIPGYLIPADLTRISAARGWIEADILEWAKRELLASPGATVEKDGRRYQIQTLVPARKLGGECLYLDENDRCTIHADAPFACAFFDAHQLRVVSDYRSMTGLAEIERAHQSQDLYARIWNMLDRLGKRAPDVTKQRQKLRRYLNESL